VYAQAPANVDSAVEQAVDAFIASTRTVGPSLVRGEIELSFFERRQHTMMMGLVTEEERVFFEHWRIPLVIAQQTLPDVEVEKAELTKLVLQIATLVNTKYDHLPPPPSSKAQSALYAFQFKLSDDPVSPRPPSFTTWIKQGVTLPV